MPFLRVRDLSTKHEYDAPVSQVLKHPEFYVVLDKTPVSLPGKPKFYIKPAAKAAHKPPRSKAEESKKSGGNSKKEES